MAYGPTTVGRSSSHVRPPATGSEPTATTVTAERANGGDRPMTPVEPMLAVAGALSGVYLLAWWYWWDAIVDRGIELEYSE